jgi:hypothetical protein
MKIRLALSFLSMAALLSADTLLLKNGSTINGRFVSGDSNSIRFAVGGQTNIYDVVDIDSMRFSGAPSSASNNPPNPPPAAYYPSERSEGAPASTYSQNSPPAPPPSAYPPPASATAQNGPPSNSTQPDYPPPPNANASSGNMEVPSGTQINVRLIDGVDSQKDSLGQTFRASVESPVVVNGQTLIPRGSDAVAVLSQAQQSGKIEGKTLLTLALRSVSVNGHTYDLATSNVEKASNSRSKKSGEVIGGTAVLGAIIGALAGGGRGAAIGAVSGAGVGTAAQVMTSGERVKIPSETVLTFALQNPLYISANQ